MHLLDWILIIVPLGVILGIGLYTRQYMRSVADFLSGGRLAGRYLLAVARGEMQAGAVVFVALFEVISKSGFTLNWWSWINVPVGLLVAITGFVVYRYRETRAMTLAQFFEIRYSKSFRVFAGALGFIAGLVNFGIIPAVGARFISYFLGFPPTVTFFSIPVPTYFLVMAVLLSLTLILTLSGGLITSMLTNCVEGIISQVLYLVIIFGLLSMFSWPEISHVLGDRPPGQSLLNPFDSMGLEDFNLWYTLMCLLVGVYGTMAWQNQSSYNSASLTAHESRMGGILSAWRESGKSSVVTLLAVCALTYLYHPDFAAQSAQVQAEVAQIPDKQIQQQMLVPLALAHLLPVGLKGALCVILLMGVFGGDSTHLHSWGGLFIQDVLVPFCKKPFTPAQHILYLRLSISGVALFAFLFGCLFRQTEYIVMWWNVTMALYIGGAGAVIIGGLYWKKGTTAGAWTALVSGSLFSTGGILARQLYGDAFPLNGMQISFFATITAITLYIIVSLLTHREDFNMDRMLHRGSYAPREDRPDQEAVIEPKAKFTWGRIIGFDENFTLGDKWIAGSLFGWGMLWFGVFVVGSVWNLIAPWPLPVWSTFWHIVGIGIPIVVTVVTSLWFTWGGIHDMRALFRRLRQEKINPLDNGMVINHQNLDESPNIVSTHGGDTQRLSFDMNRQRRESKIL